MLPTMNTSLDHLQIPNREGSSISKPRRTSSFIIKPNPFDKRIPSNLSLPCVNHSILKASTSFCKPPSVASGLSVYYTPMINEDDDKIEVISSRASQTIESSPPTPAVELSSVMKTNLIKTDTVLKQRKRFGLCSLLQTGSTANPFLHKRYLFKKPARFALLLLFAY